MRRSVGFVVVAALFLSAGWLRAQDTYPIKIKDVAEGDVSQVDKNETTTFANKQVDGAGKVQMDAKSVVNETASYVETIKKCEKGKTPTLVERKYDKAVVTTDGKAKEMVYQGKTVVIEKKGDKYQFTVGGKELAAADATSLTKEFGSKTDESADLEKAFLPKEAVKVNGSWKPDIAQFVKVLTKAGDMEIDTDKAKGTGTLLKAYKKDDKQFGEMKVDLTLPVKSIGKGAMKLTGQEGAVMTFEMTVDACIDGSSGTGTMKGGMKMDFKASPDGKAMVIVSVQGTIEETKKELPKK